MESQSAHLRSDRQISPRDLIDPRFDHDSCGVGFVATSHPARASHAILQMALVALSRLEHRGATAADGKSSDGVGVMTALPEAFFLRDVPADAPATSTIGVGMLFIPAACGASEAALERSLSAHGFGTLRWRDVPTDQDCLGEIARSVMPRIRQIVVRDLRGEDQSACERRLYLVRKQFERAHARGAVEGYICSLSTRTIVYKAMCSGRLLPDFYPDLKSADFITPFAIFHQRYATNTTPTWHRAQPGRTLAHNGEINTVWGNRARMAARDSTLPVECKPILTEGGTDSTSLDETAELLSRNGRTLAESVRMLLPPATSGRPSSPFLRYHMDCTEPWDGPAAIAFGDGTVVGAALDRNGLRPCRYALTRSGLVVAGSEAGLVDLDPAEVTHSGRLGPGQMLLVDLERGEVLEDAALMRKFDADPAYTALVADEPLAALAVAEVPSPAVLLATQRGFGYSREDVKMILEPMARDGKDPVWSMGDDTALAFLAKTPRPVYAYFRQRFAQVTNPAIDPLREACVISLHTRLGPWAGLLDRDLPLPGISLDSPLLSLGQVAALRAGRYPHAMKLIELQTTFAAAQTLEQGLDRLCDEAVVAVREGARLLLLSDRSASEDNLPLPMVIATGAVHQALVAAGLRTLAGLAVEAGDCRDIHHAAVLIGYGAGAVCPWLALETALSLAPDGSTAAAAEQKMLRSLETGLAKVMSKMGISVVDSYRGAHLFDCLGLHASVIDRCFRGTPSPISGVGFAELERQLRRGWAPVAGSPEAADALPDYGWVRFRKNDPAEPHTWQPSHVKALQTVVGSVRGAAPPQPGREAFSKFSGALDAREGLVLRDLLEIRSVGAPVDVESVESAQSLCRRFVASAMSLGSLSPEAHQTITEAMNLLGGRSNTGEGGEDSAVYRVPAPRPFAGDHHEAAEPVRQVALLTAPAPPEVLAGSASRNNKIKQIASGRFGVTAAYLAHAEEIEIKIAQGAKPGEGGQLPGFKVSGLIAQLRHAQPGVSLISPPPHHDIYSIEDLAQLIYDLKQVNPRAAVGVKLVSSCGVGTVAAGVAKAYADYVVIAGNTGGTGAAALSSIKYAGNPWELGLAEAQQVLVRNGMRGRVRLRTDGGLATARDVLIAALLGADEYAFGTAVLVALGCDMARQCHLNTCPTGIATQKPELRAKFRGRPEHVVRFFTEIAEELRQLLAANGFRSIAEAIGRVDLLTQARFDGNVDLHAVLAQVGEGPRSWSGVRNTQPQPGRSLEEAWIEPALQSAERGESFVAESAITNRDRALGARLAGEVALRRAQGEFPLRFTARLHGTAGQSFGAFAVEGMELILSGAANDFVGKGLSGGEIVLRALGEAAEHSEEHVILGNVALYGATAGMLFAAGRAGERFAVRNSGAVALVEGVGDHGCEYMTGGQVVVLGPVGANFGAGMTGGRAWVLDADGSFLGERRYHPEFLAAEPFASVDEVAQAELKELVLRHAARSESRAAARLLAAWPASAAPFVRLTPLPQA